MHDNNEIKNSDFTGTNYEKDKKALKDFIEETLKNRKAPYKWIRIGTVRNEAQGRIEQKCGAKVTGIHIDNSSVIHAMIQAHHHLEPDALLHAVDVINTTNDISISEKKHKSNDVLIFKQDINGYITFLTEVHVKNGYLLVFDAWRQKKARRDPDAAKRLPGAYVQNESPSADT
ncbi:MAG: hypothetical protein LBI28_06105 [Treponema sp.]|nr:hypothetical protein [Treponema sp.]